MAHPADRTAAGSAADAERRSWKFRPPPAGLTATEFRQCRQHDRHGSCRLGAQCVEAHGWAELEEWKVRWNIRREHFVEQVENQVDQTLLERLRAEAAADVAANFAPQLPFAICCSKTPSNDDTVTVTSKPAATKWIVELKSDRPLLGITLLHDSHREHFHLSSVQLHDGKTKFGTVDKNRQEWTNRTGIPSPGLLIITVKFKSNVYGSFRQELVFDFATRPYLSKKLKVDVYPANEGLELSEDGERLTISTEKQWTEENSEIVRLSSRPVDDEHSCLLRQRYPAPSKGFHLAAVYQDTAMVAADYKERMHGLLSVEELAQTRILSRFNLCGNLMLTTHYIISPGPLSTAKYCNGKNELFGKLELSSKISEDSAAGRLILNSCNVALLSFGLDSRGHRRAYECVIEDKTKDAIYLRVNEQLVRDFNLQHGSEFSVQAQFQLSRSSFCEKHWALDLCDANVLFPDTCCSRYRFSGGRGASELGGLKLNEQQAQAVMAIASDPGAERPPIVIAGPFGTGKTFTFAQAIEVILSQPASRVLVCTHSNSAADLYVKDYLHPLVQSGQTHFRPLRVYYRVRWLATVHHTVIEYCLVEPDSSKGCSFRMPTLDEIEQHRVVVTTLGTTNYLLQAGVRQGFFSHILIDEAAQCTECDVLLPLSLADRRTRIALAGDHMQLNSEVFSQVAREQQFQVSLLERLYDRYPADFPCRIILGDNYRSHSAIVKLTSELFYENRLRSVGSNAQHAHFYPLSFRVAKGADVQDSNSASCYNMAEIYEIGEVVDRLQQTWPTDTWGRFDDNSIGVVSPYSDQVSRLRVHLRNRKLFGVNVERVLNVQGKQFRVIILSTVRTRTTCVDEEKDKKNRRRIRVNDAAVDSSADADADDDDDFDPIMDDEETQFGFLSSARLLNTAVTRARSLVVVVGDPLALCSVGKCRKLWERYVEVCRDWNSLEGISWVQLRCHLDALEMKKLYGLNPMAPEFVPKVLRAGGQPLVMSGGAPSSAPSSPAASTPQNLNASGGVGGVVVGLGGNGTAGVQALAPFYSPPPAVFPAYPPPPPPPFHSQWFLPCSPRRQLQQQLQLAGAGQAARRHQNPPRPAGVAVTAAAAAVAIPPPTLAMPPPVANHAFAAAAPFTQLAASFQNTNPSARLGPPAVHQQHQQHLQQHQQQLQDLQQSYRGFDISYTAAMNRAAAAAAAGVGGSGMGGAGGAGGAPCASPAHRAISKPLTVQQLEATLFKKDAKPEAEASWSSSPGNASIWTPLSGPSLWDGAAGAVFCKDFQDPQTKNDSVPLYMRTSNNNGQLSDDEMDLLVNSFLSGAGVSSSGAVPHPASATTQPTTSTNSRPSAGNQSDDDEEQEDVPLWADGNEDLIDDFEGKTLQFEQSVLRTIRSEHIFD